MKVLAAIVLGFIGVTNVDCALMAKQQVARRPLAPMGRLGPVARWRNGPILAA